VFTATSLALSSIAHPLDNWVRRSPVATGANLTSVTHGNGRFVATGFSSVVISEDGTNWNWVENSKNGSGVAFGDGKFFMPGGPMLVSEDGTNWTPHGTTAASFFNGAWGNGK